MIYIFVYYVLIYIELQKTAVQCTKEVHVKHEEMVSILEKHRKSLLDKI